MRENRLLAQLREGGRLTFPDQLRLIVQLSVPAIMAQLSSVVMQYIDASMVGALGKQAAASVGLMASSTWFLNNMCLATATGFYVQVAQYIGAGKEQEARRVTGQGLACGIGISLALALTGVLLSPHLPRLYGGNADITGGASAYFRIYAMAVPLILLNNLAGGALQSSGNMVIPSILHVVMCVLDVIFNFFFIFPARTVSLAGSAVTLPGAGLGVAGAAIGTALAIACSATAMLYFLLVRSPALHIRSGEALTFRREELTRAVRIGLPVAVERGVINGAQIAGTRIIAPLGTVAIAANSFAITAEGICYLPGYGVAAAAITLIGQSVGAKRRDMEKKLGWMLTFFGMAVMGAGAALVYIFAPQMISLLTREEEVHALAVDLLRIVAFVEPMFGASIVIAGIFRGAGRTVVSSLINLFSMWLIRLPLMLLMAGKWGLKGAWYAMVIELTIRGILFLAWLYGNGRKAEAEAI